MKNDKKFKDLRVGEKLKLSESLGAKVAKIMNTARSKCNLLLHPTGYGVNIKIEFYKVEDSPMKELKTEEVVNG